MLNATTSICAEICGEYNNKIFPEKKNHHSKVQNIKTKTNTNLLIFYSTANLKEADADSANNSPLSPSLRED